MKLVILMLLLCNLQFIETLNDVYIVRQGTLDNNHNGYLDAIQIIFNQDVNDKEIDLAVREHAFTVESYQIDIESGWKTGDVVNDRIGYIVLFERAHSDPGDTGARPKVEFTAGVVQCDPYTDPLCSPPSMLIA